LAALYRRPFYAVEVRLALFVNLLAALFVEVLAALDEYCALV